MLVVPSFWGTLEQHQGSLLWVIGLMSGRRKRTRNRASSCAEPLFRGEEP